jgi:hypothetical protein
MRKIGGLGSTGKQTLPAPGMGVAPAAFGRLGLNGLIGFVMSDGQRVAAG